MIHDTDRSGYFGGSDCRFIMAANRNTKTWKHWWSTKLGEVEPDFQGSIYTRAGNLYEHGILETIDPEMTLDGQIIYEKYLLRVNYDGYKDGVIYEVKTHKSEKNFEIIPAYWQQCQVEMFVYKTLAKQWFLPEFKELYLASYALYPDEYYSEPDEVEIDPDRIILHPVRYDKAWIKGEYIPKVRELSKALKKHKMRYETNIEQKSEIDPDIAEDEKSCL